MKTWMIAAAALLLTTMVAVQAQAPAPAPAQGAAAPAGNAETGRKLYTSYGCWQCHGYEGQGGVAGARLAGRLMPLAGFTAYVRRPVNQMPPYVEKVLPAADLAHIYAFLQSRPAPPPLASIPLLQK